MLRHCRAGIPNEVMGLMIGEFVDAFTINVTDVFSMPQCGSSATVESIDEAYQSTMLHMLQHVGEKGMVVGWYHSHPGFGCWLSNVDIFTQQVFEMLDKRVVAVVVDPIQSVKGSLVMDCFRLVGERSLFADGELKQCNSNTGHEKRINMSGLVHGLDKQYTSFVIKHSQTRQEVNYLKTLMGDHWSSYMLTSGIKQHRQYTIDQLDSMCELLEKQEKLEEETKNKAQTATKPAEDDYKVKSKFMKSHFIKRYQQCYDDLLRQAMLNNAKISILRALI